MAARLFTPTSHASLPRATQQALLLFLLDFNTLFMLLTKGIANVFLSVTGPSFICSINKKKKKKAPKAVASISALQRSRLVQWVLTAANRNCKQRPNGNESGRQKGVKIK